jgi:hypothetical protein
VRAIGWRSYGGGEFHNEVGSSVSKQRRRKEELGRRRHVLLMKS